MVDSRLGGRPEERLTAGSGDDANAKVFLQLLEEDEGEHSVRNQADTCRDETLEGDGGEGGGGGYQRGAETFPRDDFYDSVIFLKCSLIETRSKDFSLLSGLATGW